MFTFSCTNQNLIKKKSLDPVIFKKYSNDGFTLVYSDDLYKSKIVNKKLDDRELFVLQKNLKKDSTVKITNLLNNKSIIAKVKSKSKYPNFYNSVITNRIAIEIDLDLKEPFVHVESVDQNSVFYAGKAKTFDEEKNVAEKAPVSKITIDDLGATIKKVEIIDNQSFLYSIKVADFYYKYSAENMIKRIETETSLKNYVIKKLSKTKYRVLLGPFDDIKKIENTFNEIKSLDFENLEILKDV